MKTEPGFIYILRCADSTLYTGWTYDVASRVEAHNAGHGAKYTRSRLPVTLAYKEQLPGKKEAMQREWQIKRMSRAAKLRLIGAGYAE